MTRAAFPVSIPHRHAPGSPCLTEIDKVPKGLEQIIVDDKDGSTNEIAVGPGWYRCSAYAYYFVHDHGTRLVSHFPTEKAFARCPE
jgi:hypothetical protein